MKITGKWAYLERAGDKEGQPSECLLTPPRERDAAESFLPKALRTQGRPEKLTFAKRGANPAAITHYHTATQPTLVLRSSKYLNNMVEQVHRAVNRLVRPI